MRIRGLVVVAFLASCGDRDGSGSDSGVGAGRVEVGLFPTTPATDVDILFVIDDSPGMLEHQTNLKNNFPNFINVLNIAAGGLPNGLPSVHIGVVSSDLGTKGADDAQYGPGIGNGPGSCSGNGKAGNLQNSTTVVQGAFIIDIRNSDGTRTTNYSGSLANAFSGIASLGASGCGFEQSIEAAKRALNNNPANAGFLRPNAALAVILVTDEDDCSISHSTLFGSDTNTFGPLQSFRCTRFGVTCDEGGATEAMMNTIGNKAKCHSNENSLYLTKVASYVDWLKGLKPDPRLVFVASMTAPATPVRVEPRMPPGGGTAIPALAPSCVFNSAAGPIVADPAVRVQQLANKFGFARGVTTSLCAQDLSPPLTQIAGLMRNMFGSQCIARSIATPPDCKVFDATLTTERELPACSGAVTTDCYMIVADTPDCGGGFEVQVMRSTPPAAGTMVSVRCY